MPPPAGASPVPTTSPHALQVTWWPGPDDRVDKAVRAALLRRSRQAPGLRHRIGHPRTRAVRLLAGDGVLRVRATRTATAPGGEWLLHDLDDGDEVAWGYRPDGVRDVIAANRWPEALEPGDAATVLVVVWPDDLSHGGLETPTFDLALAWAGGSDVFPLPSAYGR